MSPSYIHRELLSLQGEDLAPASDRRSTHEYAMFEEFAFVRREAQAEANLAYGDWRRDCGRDAYVVYRAAQDRADAAQDRLADWARRLES